MANRGDLPDYAAVEETEALDESRNVCRVSNCLSPTEYGSNFCKEHALNAPHKPNREKKPRYCFALNCMRHRKADSQYCDKTMCVINGCMEHAMEGRQVCESHDDPVYVD